MTTHTSQTLENKCLHSFLRIMATTWPPLPRSLVFEDGGNHFDDTFDVTAHRWAINVFYFAVDY